MDLNFHVSQRLTEAISALAHELCEIRKDRQKDSEIKKGLNAIENKLALMEKKIMSAISDYSAKVEEQFSAINANVDEIVESQQNLAGDVTSLKDIILKLQNNAGPISPEDQLLLDQGVEKVTALATKTAAVSAALKELAASTEDAPTPA